MNWSGDRSCGAVTLHQHSASWRVCQKEYWGGAVCGRCESAKVVTADHFHQTGLSQTFGQDKEPSVHEGGTRRQLACRKQEVMLLKGTLSLVTCQTLAFGYS